MRVLPMLGLMMGWMLMVNVAGARSTPRVDAHVTRVWLQARTYSALEERRSLRSNSRGAVCIMSLLSGQPAFQRLLPPCSSQRWTGSFIRRSYRTASRSHPLTSYSRRWCECKAQHMHRLPVHRCCPAACWPAAFGNRSRWSLSMPCLCPCCLTPDDTGESTAGPPPCTSTPSSILIQVGRIIEGGWEDRWQSLLVFVAVPTLLT
ncbi:hypothetical protein V8E36_004505 [Tilletia maclaganii]